MLKKILFFLCLYFSLPFGKGWGWAAFAQTNLVPNQNVPNPFAEQTIITYNIPQNTGTAQLLFYDMNGRQIKTVDITTKGAGQLNVFANDLTSGMYSYTLVVDGKIVDTKKMVKQ